MTRIESVALGSILLVLGSTDAGAMCATLSIRIRGAIDKPRADSAVRVDVRPGPRLGPSSFVVAPDSEGRFVKDVPFNAFNGGGLFGTGLFGHDCSRQPEVVVLSLIEGGEVVGTAHLDVTKDFTLHRGALEYTLKHDVVLTRGP